MKRLLIIFTLVLSAACIAFADAGSSHIIKAKIKIDNQEMTGYFRVWGYLYLETRSVKNWQNAIPDFTKQAKDWIYGDTLILYSEIIDVKEANLFLFPVDKTIKLNKSKVKEIYPIDLISNTIGRDSDSEVKSVDGEWLKTKVQLKQHLNSDGGCSYTLLYFQKPDKGTIEKVKSLRLEMNKTDRSKNSYEEEKSLIEKLRSLKVIVYHDCTC